MDDKVEIQHAEVSKTPPWHLLGQIEHMLSTGQIVTAATYSEAVRTANKFAKRWPQEAE